MAQLISTTILPLRREQEAGRVVLYILGNECCERLAYYGIHTNLVNYFKFQLDHSSVEAVSNVTNWSGTYYVTPLIGAFLADAYLGRYWTIASFSIIYVFGMTLLTLPASLPGLKPRCNAKNVCDVTGPQTGVFYMGLYLIALGTGGIKPCVSSFWADQLMTLVRLRRRARALSATGSISQSTFVHLWPPLCLFGYRAMWAVGGASVSLPWLWWWPLSAFSSGMRLYQNQRPRVSPLTRILQVLVASFKKAMGHVPDDESLLYETAEKG